MKPKVVTEYITTALVELLKTKDLHDISTTELIRKAGVCRSSYYRNYYYLEDVLKKHIEMLFDRIEMRTLETSDDLKENLVEVYRLFLTEREFFTIITRRKLLYLLDEPLYNLCDKHMHFLGIQDSPYLTPFYAGASMYIFRAWIRSDYAQSPEELAEITYRHIATAQYIDSQIIAD